jgi:hypothetical protein
MITEKEARSRAAWLGAIAALFVVCATPSAVLGDTWFAVGGLLAGALLGARSGYWAGQAKVHGELRKQFHEALNRTPQQPFVIDNSGPQFTPFTEEQVRNMMRRGLR